MDLNDYWQENKRFLTTVAGGALAFLIGRAVIGSVYGSELRAKKISVSRSETDLRASRFGSRDLNQAREINESLEQAVAELSTLVTFVPREAFHLDPQRGSATNQYIETVATVRENLMRLARRKSLRLPEDLGLPGLSPTRDIKIERFLEGLDIVDRIVRIAMEEGVERIEKIQIKLDPKLDSSRGVGLLEQTRVSFRMSGHSTPLVRLLARTQNDVLDALEIDSLELRPERSKPEESQLDVTFVVARLHALDEEEI